MPQAIPARGTVGEAITDGKVARRGIPGGEMTEFEATPVKRLSF